MVNKKIFSQIVFLITLAIIFSFFNASFANSYRLINFQGKLTDQQGELLDGIYTVIFSIYATATGGTALWTERHENLSVSEGLVNTLLGSIIERYLGITIDVDNNENSPDPEMLPRQKIIPAIYAYDADTLDSKDSSEYTTPQTDAGRSGVVNTLYEGEMTLEEKYLKRIDTINIKENKPTNPIVGDTYFNDFEKMPYIFNGDSWQEYRGPQGSQGPQGPRGPQGLQGPKGDPGPLVAPRIEQKCEDRGCTPSGHCGPAIYIRSCNSGNCGPWQLIYVGDREGNGCYEGVLWNFGR